MLQIIPLTSMPYGNRPSSPSTPPFGQMFARKSDGTLREGRKTREMVVVRGKAAKASLMTFSLYIYPLLFSTPCGVSRQSQPCCPLFSRLLSLCLCLSSEHDRIHLYNSRCIPMVLLACFKFIVAPCRPFKVPVRVLEMLRDTQSRKRPAVTSAINSNHLITTA